MNDWVAILRESVAGEWDIPPLIAALATVDSQGTPHVRHVVCRRIDDGGNIAITSDRRSAKNQHIRQNPNVELALWLPQRREQFRIAGAISIDSHREEIWKEMSDSSRATFFWPIPGEPLNSDQMFPQGVPVSVSPPMNFEILLLTPQQVDHLELVHHPHRRRRWRNSTNWSVELLNP
jgi:pyridoxamine 5'-phosphate oxidase